MNPERKGGIFPIDFQFWPWIIDRNLIKPMAYKFLSRCCLIWILNVLLRSEFALISIVPNFRAVYILQTEGGKQHDRRRVSRKRQRDLLVKYGMLSAHFHWFRNQRIPHRKGNYEFHRINYFVEKLSIRLMSNFGIAKSGDVHIIINWSL